MKLLSFIVSNNSLAFWICSVSLHACNYLEKTISLREYFDYVLELGNLSSQEMKSIVLKRNRLSGYVVRYENLTKESPRKKGELTQSGLETEYFRELNRHARSNISLTFYYWLLSVSEFTENEIILHQFTTPDFSFLEALNFEKVYTLVLIVLHGKMSVNYHALISNQSYEMSFRILTILKEDSILLLKGDYYYLNGILYRHVVQLLKSRNLLI
jgi:hypothetical protein